MKLTKYFGIAMLLLGGYAHASCTLYVGTLRFENYNGGDSRGYGKANVSCKDGVGPAKLLLSPGGNSGNNYLKRRMRRTNASNFISYQFFTNGRMSRVWGDGTQGTDTLSVTGSQQFTIYGLIPRNQVVPAGEYSDTVRMTVAY